jgi:SAM-dependent methyltransferase
VNKSLVRVVSWGHELLAEVVAPGDLAVDLTAGNGCDTLVLARLVGGTGQVVAFDVQPAALENSDKRLREAGFEPRLCNGGEGPLPRQAGVDLVAAGHERLEEFLPGSARVVVANLGYLPGGDTRLITRTGSTLKALEQASRLLAVGGRMAVVVYGGHPGGAEESAAVEQFFAKLDECCFQVLQIKVVNRFQAPYLLVAEKIRGKI